jgi:hypothetical protein
MGQIHPAVDFATNHHFMRPQSSHRVKFARQLRAQVVYSTRRATREGERAWASSTIDTCRGKATNREHGIEAPTSNSEYREAPRGHTRDSNDQTARTIQAQYKKVAQTARIREKAHEVDTNERMGKTSAAENYRSKRAQYNHRQRPNTFRMPHAHS